MSNKLFKAQLSVVILGTSGSHACRLPAGQRSEELIASLGYFLKP
jgi:hypothetical protein